MAKAPIAKISIEGLDEVTRKLHDVLPREALQLQRGTVGSIASAARKALVAEAPKRTGQLRKSFFVKRNRGTKNSEVSADVRARSSGFYWRFQNFGTVEQAPNPFVDRVVAQMRERLPQLMREEFGKRLEKLLAKKKAKK